MAGLDGHATRAATPSEPVVPSTAEEAKAERHLEGGTSKDAS
jgi:hypothetical protein